MDPGKDAWAAGLRKNDRLVAMDGQSLRYLSVELIQKSFLSPRYSGFGLEFERDIFLHKEAKASPLSHLGFDLKLEYQGLTVEKVKSQGFAERGGLKDRDFLVAVNGDSTRYTPPADVKKLIEKNSDDRIVLTVHRTALLTRK